MRLHSVTHRVLNLAVEPLLPKRSEKHQLRSTNVILRLEFDGYSGYGEASIYPGLTEPLADTLDGLVLLQEAIGRELESWPESADLVSETCPALRAAVEQAACDAFARRNGRPLPVTLGTHCGKIYTSLTLMPGGIDDLRLGVAKSVEAGYRVLKVKATGHLHDDLGRLDLVNELAPNADIHLECNGRYGVRDAQSLLSVLTREDRNVVLVEQLLNKRLNRESLRLSKEFAEIPLCFDDGIRKVDDLRNLLQVGHVDAINVKLMKSGMKGSLDLISVARTEGVAVVFGGISETVVGTTFAASIAMANCDVIRHVDLDSPLFMPSMPDIGGIQFGPSGEVIAPTCPGSGIEACRLLRQTTRPASPSE